MSDIKPRGVRTDGVRTFDDIMQRCWIDEITGCWRWRHGIDGNGAPSLWIPAIQRAASLGVAICAITTGRAPAKGEAWHCTCETKHCANPKHRICGTRASQMQAANVVRTPVQRANMAKAKRRGSKISEEAVDDIRNSDEFLHVLAERHGCSKSAVWNIKRYRTRRALAAPGSSVFNLGG